MIDFVTVVLLGAILVVLVNIRITIGTRIAVLANDVDWISRSLAKWGMIPPQDRPDGR